MNPRTTRSTLACLALAAGAVLVPSAVFGVGTSASAAVPNRPADQFAELTGVATLSPTGAWAVGDYDNGSETATLVQHWNGTVWSRVPSPNPGGPYGSELKGVSAIGPANVWAVGTYQVESSAFHPLIEHWNGHQWRNIPAPTLGGSQDVELDAVSAVSQTDVWAVGVYDPPGPDTQHSLVIRWDGTAWSVVATPKPAGITRYLLGVSAATDATGWAVGASSGLTNGLAPISTMALRWDGHHWTRDSTPNAGSHSNELTAVSTVAPGNTWAVGQYANNSTTTFGLIEHYTGGAWHRVTGPPLGAGTALTGVSGSSGSDVWAVGGSGGFSNPESLMLHWDGSTWHTYQGPGPTGITMQGVTDAGSGRTWTVGVRGDVSGFFAVRETWNGHVWIKR